MQTTMTGKEVCRLMRVNGVTIRALAARMQITMKRVREVRTTGTASLGFTMDYVQAITGAVYCDGMQRALEAAAA